MIWFISHMLDGTFLKTPYVVLRSPQFSRCTCINRSAHACYILHVYNACFRQSEARNILQICNIICINGIHISNGRIIFITGYVCERNMLFWRCTRSHDVPIWIIQLLITKFMFDMFKMHIQWYDLYYIYLEYYSRLSQTYILNMPIIHLLSRTEQFLEVHPEHGATSERYSILKDHPI